MELAGRMFGFSTWSMLVPQALEGVAAVALLYATVRRVTGPVYGLLAGLALALTPAAVLMFRFTTPTPCSPCCSPPRPTPSSGPCRQAAGAGWRWPGSWSASASSPRWARRCWSSPRSAWPTC